MCAAASVNTSGDLDTIVAHCLAYTKRRFVDVAEDFPEECLHLLEILREVYRNDETRSMSPPERLRLITRSLPLSGDFKPIGSPGKPIGGQQGTT
jgi:transposase